MIARMQKTLREKDQGFTLIELLIVMIIIGILAAIAIPLFLSQQKKARETSAKADVTTIGKEMASYYVDGTGTLAVTSTTATPPVWTLTSAGGTNPGPVSSANLSKGNAALGAGTAATTTGVAAWCAQVTTSDTVTWKFNSVAGLTQGTCSGAV